MYLCCCSFHTSRPERPQKTQHTGLQEVLVFVMMVHLFFFPPVILENFSSISPLSAGKSALLATLAQNDNLISKLRTIAAHFYLVLFFNWSRRKEFWFQGAQIFSFLGSSIFFLFILSFRVTETWFHMYIL